MQTAGMIGPEEGQVAGTVTDALEEESTPGDQVLEVSGRLVDRLDPRLVNVLTVLGFGLPIVVYFWMVHRYSLNVIVSDQLSDMTPIGNSYTHLFDWSSLWAQHNENRIFFPNMIVVVLAHTTRFNVQIEEYLSGGMLVASTALIIWSHKRRSPATPWLYYCPVALLALSVVQYGNTLWGFQMAWFLILLALATTVALIDRVTLTWLSMTGAIVAAVIGSFSSVQGLLIWPAGLVLLYHRRRSLRAAVVWMVAAVASVIIYFRNFDIHQGMPHHAYLWQYPLRAVKFYLFAAGDVIGVPQQYNGPGNNAVLLLGAVILMLAVFTLAVYGIRRDEEGGSPIGVALICVGLLFIFIVDWGRIIFGYSAASQSRYTTYDLLIPIGIVLAFLGRPSLGVDDRSSEERSEEEPADMPRQGTTAVLGRYGRAALPIARWVVAVVIAVQVVVGLHYSIGGARKNYVYQVHAVPVLRNIDHESNATILVYVDYFAQAPFIRRQIRIAQLHHLSVFADDARP